MSNFEDALERFQQVGLEYGGGLANHGPMAAQALESLGHQAKIPAFVDVYAPRLPPLERGAAIPEEAWDEALGRIERAPDWVVTFEAAVEEEGVPATLRRALPRLLPGLFAAAGHGLLRVAHGLRALAREDAAIRRREVAHGLAHWAARHQRLPGAPGSRASGAELQATLDAWPLRGEAQERRGYFFEAVRALDGWAPYVDAVEAMPLPRYGAGAGAEAEAGPGAEDVDDWLDVVCRHAASLFVKHPAARVAYVHTLTIPSGLRELLPHLGAAERVRAAGYALQAVGALHSMFGESAPAPEDDEEVLRVAGQWAEARYHAACSIQEHAIKMTEACWREDQRRPDPAFQRAGADAALKIGGRGEASAC